MRKLELLCVGKIKESYYRDGIAEYLKRLGRFCDASVVEISDLADDVGAAEKESKALLSRMDGFVILSDLRGKLLTSEELAATLERGYLRAPKVQFVIGGSRGVTDEVRARADDLPAPPDAAHRRRTALPRFHHFGKRAISQMSVYARGRRHIFFICMCTTTCAKTVAVCAARAWTAAVSAAR